MRARALTGHYGYLSRYSNDLIFLSDQNGIIIEANERCESALAIMRSPPEVCARRARRLLTTQFDTRTGPSLNNRLFAQENRFCSVCTLPDFEEIAEP